MCLIEQVNRQCQHLKLSSLTTALPELLQQAETNELSYLQYTDLLLGHEVKTRNDKRLSANRRKAGFPIEKHLESFDYRHQTTITKRQVNQLLDFDFIDNRHNLIFIGPPGVGKTHLSIGISLKAIDAGYKVLFVNALSLVETLEVAELKGELKKKISSLCKFDLLIIDELGYLPMNKQGNYNLFQLINALYEYRSIILTTNKDFTAWGEFFVDENVAVPIIDRLIHHSKIFMLGGESYRLKQKTNT
ncbi:MULTISPECIES: IS21-like element helper ATPase IstB [Bacteria]|uniref:IS21-like element helper ATPase IstB n=1 Tax=Bacteria TaxID=2 RepID=UPI0018DB305F|nr:MULTISPECIES: IS21-like element helper ATPase IstB [Bacteria]